MNEYPNNETTETCTDYTTRNTSESAANYNSDVCCENNAGCEDDTCCEPDTIDYASQVTDLIKYNPLLKKPLLCTLSLCEEGEITDRLALECAAQEVWSDDYRQSPEVSIDILIRNGALTEQVFVDGAVYDGALEDIQLDETIPDDAVAEVCINMTEIGQHLLNAYAPETTLQTLLREKPQYHEVFLTALKTCDSECGCSRTDLESALNEMPPLQPNPDTLRREVYPQYFIDALEAAGGIVWQGAWRTTDVGKAALAQQCAA